MKLKLIAILLSSLATHSVLATDLAVTCEIIETPTGINDSWSLKILNDRAAFFDNDHYSYAQLDVSKKPENDSDYRTYRSTDANDPFHIVIDNPERLYGEYPNDEIYAEIFLGKQHRPSIFACKKTSVEVAAEAFEE